MVSDHHLLKWFALYARETPSFQEYLSNPIQSLSLPSLDLNNAVVSATSSKKILDAMKLMSEEGVSSIAVVEDRNGVLLSAVSVTDIGKVFHNYIGFFLFGVIMVSFLDCGAFSEQSDIDDFASRFHSSYQGDLLEDIMPLI